MTQSGASGDHATLPLPDYDHLPVGSLQHRIRTLDLEGLAAVATYEREHADRVQVLQMIEHRLDELRAGAEPSGGDPGAVAPELAPAAAGGSPVSPVTSGPPINPPTGGDPTNPAQPRS